MKNDEEFITAKEIAARLRIARATVYLWANQGKIPCFRLGPGTVRFPRAEYEAWEARARVITEAGGGSVPVKPMAPELVPQMA